jgi:hypothetical protein
MQQHVHGRRPRLPAELIELESLLERFMSRHREDRFPDAIAAAAAVRGMLEQMTPPMASSDVAAEGGS